ncbi:MAG: hypothetical protein ACODAB_04550 [Gemmatimonadota bacterium]
MRGMGSSAAVVGTAVAALAAAGLASSAADRPNGIAGPERPCADTGQRQFDFWLGDWVVENRQSDPTTPEDPTLHPTGTAAASVHSILEGCAVVEHWEGYLVPDRHVLGFSLRTFDLEAGRWRVLLNWPGPGAPSFFEIEGSFDGDVANFVFPRPAGGFARYRFLDTSTDRPRWEGAVAEAADGPWSPFWVMQFAPRDPVAGGEPHVGPSRTTGRCPDPAARSFDFLLGDWTGEETTPGASDDDGPVARRVEVRTLSILEGCALVDHVAVGEGERVRKEFQIRSFVPSDNRWVQYSLAAGAGEFVRHEGDEDGLVAETSDGAAGPDDPPVLERMRWQREGDDRVVRETAVSEDGGATWRTVARVELRRR